MANYVRNVVTIVAKKDDMNSFIHFLSLKGNKELDFNVFIPMPKNLNIKAPITVEELAVGAFLVDGVMLLDRTDFFGKPARESMKEFVMNATGEALSSDEKLIKAYMAARKDWYKYDGGYEEEISTDIRAYKNLKSYGYTTWYDFCVDKWGTKWNAVNGPKLDELVPVYDKSNDTYVLTFSFETAWETPRGIWENIAKRWKKITGTIEYADENYGSNTGVVYIKDGWTSEKVYKDESYEAFEQAFNVWEDDEWEELLKQKEDGSWCIDLEAM